MNNEIKNEKEREVHIEQSAKKEDVLSEQERDKKLAETLAGKKPPAESDSDQSEKKADEPPKTDDPEGQEQPPKNPEREGTPVAANEADIAKKLAEQKPPKPTETVVHTEQTSTEKNLITGKCNDAERFLGYKEYNNKAREIGRNDNLTNEEKVEAIQKVYHRTDDKTDINAPADAQYVKSFSKAGDVKYDWPPHMGFERESINSLSRDNPMPEKWDRYGHMGGNNFSSIPENGKYSYSERSIPYVENEAAYHHGTFNNETYFEKIDAIKNGDLESLNKILSSESVSPIDPDDFEMIQDTYNAFFGSTKKEPGNEYDVSYGLSGNAASWGNMSGGAEQYVTPLNGKQMKQLGMLQEDVNE